jgi:hypothetical protein
MAFDTYSSLSTALGTWGKRTYTTSQTDEFIVGIETLANLSLGNDFRREVATTITTDASGTGTLPSGFVGLVSVVRDVVGSKPLKQVSWDALKLRNPYELSDDGQVYAISGTTFQVAPIVEDNFNGVFSSTLTALSGSNPTNWLLALAPTVYLFGGKAMAAAYHEQWDVAAALEAKALDLLDRVVSQGNVAALGNAEMTLDMVTP